MDATVTYKCPNCDAGLRFNAETQRFACEFCMSSFTEAELAQTTSAERAEEKARENAEFTDEIREYYCPSCGAEVVAEKNTVADFCYYCHNPIVLSDKVSGMMKPSKIIPFKFERDQAVEEFLRFAKKKWFVPRDYFSVEQLDKITGIYYPFWVVDADTDSRIEGVGKKVRSWRSGDYKYTETSSYAVMRRGNIHFEDITASAISTEDKDMLEGILPYPCELYQDFSMPYLQGFVAKKRDIEREQLTDEIKGRMNGYAETLLRRTVKGYDSFFTNDCNVGILGSNWEYSLMPIWIMTYKKKTGKKDKTFVYAMNGVTGKIYGELPISIPKLLLTTLGVLLGVAAIVFGLGFAFFGGEYF